MLSFPLTIKDQLGVSLNWKSNVGPAGDRASWYGFSAFNNVSTIDNLMCASYSGPLNALVSAINLPSTFPAPILGALCNTQLRNNTSVECKVTVYKCYPKKDILRTAGDLTYCTGISAPLLTNGFLSTFAPTTSGTTCIQQHRPHYQFTYDLEPWHSKDWRVLFTTKKIKTIVLLPGSNWSMDIKVGARVFCKQNDMVSSTGDQAQLWVSQSYADRWTYLKRMGPVIIIKVEGVVSHNVLEEQAAMNNTSLSTRQGDYLLDVFHTWTYRYLHVPLLDMGIQNRIGYFPADDIAQTNMIGSASLMQFQESAPAEVGPT